MSSMANVLSTAKRVQIASALVEGVSVRATARMVGVSKDTVMKLGVELGEACSRFQDETLRDLTCKRLQVDELWAFVYAKAKNVPAGKEGTFGVGDVWTFTAIDADTKLMPSFLVGSRDGGCAYEFMQDLASRLANRVQLTTDGHGPYLRAVEEAFGADIDYAMLWGTPVVAGSRAALQSIGMCRDAFAQNYWQSRSETHQHVLHGAAQPHDAQEHAPVHSADERVLEAGRESLPPAGTLFRVL